MLINFGKQERFFGFLRKLGCLLEWNTALILKRPPIREDLKVLLYQSQEADNTLLHQMVHHRTALRGNGQ
jgi:hypothetical protein